MNVGLHYMAAFACSSQFAVLPVKSRGQVAKAFRTRSPPLLAGLFSDDARDMTSMKSVRACAVPTSDANPNLNAICSTAGIEAVILTGERGGRRTDENRLGVGR